MENISEIIIENNHQFVIVNKPAGVPVQKDKTEDPALLDEVMSYCHTKLHLHTRIDRPVSGIVLMGKKKSAIQSIQKSQEKDNVTKEYLAIVEGIVEQDLDLTNYLYHHTKSRKAIIADAPAQGFKDCHLTGKILQKFDRYTLLHITLTSGRFHQIRSQLSHAGFPIKGDVKYMARRGNKDRSIDLHAWKINFPHPVTSKEVTFEAPLSKEGLWKYVELATS